VRRGTCHVRRRSGTCGVSERERELYRPTRAAERVVASCSRARYGSKVGGYLPFAALIYRISRRTNTHSAGICGLFCCERDSCHYYFCTPELPCPVLKRTEVITGLVQCLSCKCTSGRRVCLFHFNSFRSVLNPLCVCVPKKVDAR